MLSYGFYNSIDGDRVYSAEDFSAFLDGIVFDGVYNAVGNCFFVETTSTSNELKIGPGRAWFNHTWTWNNSDYILEPSYSDGSTIIDRDVPLPSNTGYRIDAVVIEVNRELRENRIIIVSGTEVSISAYNSGTRPTRPTLLGKNADGTKDISYDGEIFQYALAYINRPVSSVKTVIESGDITNIVGDNSGETPMVSALALAGLPSGGKTGEILVKRSTQNGDVGWYSPSHLPTDTWYLPSGISESQVIAAFKFVDVVNEATALTSVNSGTKYYLTKSDNNVTWNTTTGFYIPASAGAGLANGTIVGNYTDVKCAAFGYHSINMGSGNIVSAPSIILNQHRILATKFIVGGNEPSTRYLTYMINKSSSTATSAASSSTSGQGKAVLAGNWQSTSAVYVNGTKISIAESNNIHTNTSGGYNRVIGQQSKSTGSYRSGYVTAVVFYSTTLSNDQHLQLANNIKALGGGL